MKKVLIMFAMILMATGIASARLVHSNTVTKTSTPSNTTWYIRAGISLNNVAGAKTNYGSIEDYLKFGTTMGYDALVGFQKPMGKSGAYWGMEFGLGTEGAKCTDSSYDETETLSFHALKIAPVMFGYKFKLTDKIKIDPHVGLFASYLYAGDPDEDFDFGLKLGAGVWFNKFNVDFSWQRGFMESIRFYDMYHDPFGCSSNFMISISYAF